MRNAKYQINKATTIIKTIPEYKLILEIPFVHDEISLAITNMLEAGKQFTYTVVSHPENDKTRLVQCLKDNDCQISMFTGNIDYTCFENFGANVSSWVEGASVQNYAGFIATNCRDCPANDHSLPPISSHQAVDKMSFF